MKWYVGTNLPGLGATAVNGIGREGINTFRTRVFPGYFFVFINEDEAGVVNRTIGVRRLLPVHRDLPLPLPDGFVEDLMARLVGGDLSMEAAAEVVERFLPGDLVMITIGPFRDRIGRFAWRRGDVTKIMSGLLGEGIGIRVASSQLKRAPIIG
jgi:transcription antitermination factor NusG